MSKPRSVLTLFAAGWICLLCPHDGWSERPKTLAEFSAQLGEETRKAYDASPFLNISKDYFARIVRDPAAKAKQNETTLGPDWRIYLPKGAGPITERMANHLHDFLHERMELKLEISHGIPLEPKGIILSESDWIEEGKPKPEGAEDGFQIYIKPEQIIINGEGARGVRDGIVKLVDLIGFRQAPILKLGYETYRPRLRYRLGAIPWQGDYKDLVFMGYNTVFVSGGNLHEMSRSSWIPELIERQNPALLDNLKVTVDKAQEYGLRTFAFLSTRQKYAGDHAVFQANPELRGALTWSKDGEYVLCTQHPLVQKFLQESIEDVFEAAPQLDGVAVIIGGEGFYHCFMRPFEAEKGHTNCKRCEAIGPEKVVANLCNLMADAARAVNPEAIVAAWPYSAEHVWSVDKAQIGTIQNFGPGTALLTEIEKDEYVKKGEKVNKHLWDYSIDLIGPGERAKKQIAACTEKDIPVFLKSEPELSFEAPRLSHIPCMDRWWDRADALASCGATGAFVFPAFRPNYGTVAAEVAKYAWWDPVGSKESVLTKLSERIAGLKGGRHLRKAWRHVSMAVEFAPELPPYYTGPYYLGPMHPMCADREAELPDVFLGYYLFYAEITDKEGLIPRPIYFMDPRGDVAVFGDFYRRMERELSRAAKAVDKGELVVPERLKILFLSEATPIRFFYRTARTHANFYESCAIRDRIGELTSKQDLTPHETKEAGDIYGRWLEILHDERENTEAAIPLLEKDVRLDPYYGSDHSFAHGVEIIAAKMEILDHEIEIYLPSVAEKLGLTADQKR